MPEPTTSTRSSRGVVPYPLAMVVCDAVWKDPSTGKHTLLGTFTEINARTFPAVNASMGIYIELTDGRGKVPILVRIIDVDETGPEIFRLEGEAKFSGPTSVLGIAFNLPPIHFPKPGEYRVQFFASGEFVIERRVMLRHRPDPRGGG